MTCARCQVPITGKGRTQLCQKCSSMAPGRRFFTSIIGHGTKMAKAKTGLRNIWSILKSLP
jgi:hypothetical protein